MPVSTTNSKPGMLSHPNTILWTLTLGGFSGVHTVVFSEPMTLVPLLDSVHTHLMAYDPLFLNCKKRNLHNSLLFQCSLGVCTPVELWRVPNSYFEINRRALQRRAMLLPYFYTLMRCFSTLNAYLASYVTQKRLRYWSWTSTPYVLQLP